MEPYWPIIFARFLQGKVEELILSGGAAGGGGGGGAAPAAEAAAADAGAGDAKKKEEKKEEEVSWARGCLLQAWLGDVSAQHSCRRAHA